MWRLLVLKLGRATDARNWARPSGRGCTSSYIDRSRRWLHVLSNWCGCLSCTICRGFGGSYHGLGVIYLVRGRAAHRIPRTRVAHRHHRAILGLERVCSGERHLDCSKRACQAMSYLCGQANDVLHWRTCRRYVKRTDCSRGRRTTPAPCLGVHVPDPAVEADSRSRSHRNMLATDALSFVHTPDLHTRAHCSLYPLYATIPTTAPPKGSGAPSRPAPASPNDVRLQS